MRPTFSTSTGRRELCEHPDHARQLQDWYQHEEDTIHLREECTACGVSRGLTAVPVQDTYSDTLLKTETRVEHLEILHAEEHSQGVTDHFEVDIRFTENNEPRFRYSEACIEFEIDDAGQWSG